MGYSTSCAICTEQGVRQSYLSAPIALKARPLLRAKRPKILFVGQDPTIRNGEATTILMLDRPRNPVSNFIRGMILNPLELTLDDVAATNAVKCTFPGNLPPNTIARDNRRSFRDETRAEDLRVETVFLRPFFDNCKQHLIGEVRELQPEIVLSLGEPCHQLLLKAFGWPIDRRLKEVFGSSFAVETPFSVDYVPCAHQNFLHKFYRAKWPELLKALKSSLD